MHFMCTRGSKYDQLDVMVWKKWEYNTWKSELRQNCSHLPPMLKPWMHVCMAHIMVQVHVLLSSVYVYVCVYSCVDIYVTQLHTFSEKYYYSVELRKVVKVEIKMILLYVLCASFVWCNPTFSVLVFIILWMFLPFL